MRCARSGSGVGAAVLLCLAVGIGLQLVNGALPQRQQEMLECVVAAIAVVMVSYMVLWMRAHSRDLRKDLQNAAGSALARGSAGALVVMAFLAVIREGFETAVFLLAAFQSALSPLQAAIGVVLGVAVAVALGYLIYRGGVKLNLSRFFRITGVVLVLVAAGLVMSTLRAAYEAGWLTVGQQTWLDLSAIARPGFGAGIAAHRHARHPLQPAGGRGRRLPAVRDPDAAGRAVAAAADAVPARIGPHPGRHGRRLRWSRRAARRVRPGRARRDHRCAGTVRHAGDRIGRHRSGDRPIEQRRPHHRRGDRDNPRCGRWPPAPPRTSPPRGRIDGGWEQHARPPPATSTCRPRPGRCPRPASPGPRSPAAVDAAAAGLPASLTAGQIAAMNNGRLPVGVRAGAAGQAFDVSYIDTVTPVLSVDTATGVVLGVDLRLVRTVLVSVPGRGSVSAGTVLDASAAADPGSVVAGLAKVADLADQTGHPPGRRPGAARPAGGVRGGAAGASGCRSCAADRHRHPETITPAAPAGAHDPPLADARVAGRSGD